MDKKLVERLLDQLKKNQAHQSHSLVFQATRLSEDNLAVIAASDASLAELARRSHSGGEADERACATCNGAGEREISEYKTAPCPDCTAITQPAALTQQAPAAQAVDAWLDRDGRMIDALRSFLEGMSVSMDVSTGDHDAGHRYFGIINEVMNDDADKNGVTLLVYDARPNFAAPIASAAQDDVARAKAIHAAVSALYFDDSADFRSALGAVVRHLDARLAGEFLGSPKAAYDTACEMLAASQSKNGGERE